MKRLLLKIALFFSLLIAPFVVLFTIPYSEEFAYHYIEHDCYNHGAWIYDRITQNPTPIDIAFIGSSHTLHAIQDKKTEEFTGFSHHVTNLGYCRYGRNMEYLILNMLLKYKSPKLVVIEIHEDEEKNSHDIFPYLAQTKDLLVTPTAINRDYFSDLINGGSARLEYFKAKYIFRIKYPKPSAERYGYAASERMVKQEEWDENQKTWQKRLGRTESERIQEMQVKYPFTYLEKAVNLLNKRNISIAFIYLPDSGSKLEIPKYMETYKKLAPVLIPPQTIFNDSTNWMDASHLNDKGSEKLSLWMAEKLRAEWCLDSIKLN